MKLMYTKKQLLIQIDVLILRLEKINGTDSAAFKWLKSLTTDEAKFSELFNVLSKVINGDKLLNFSKQLNAGNFKVKIDEAMAEYDTARDLVMTSFYGKFAKVEYLVPMKTKRWPDFRADNKAIEVKLLSPEGLDPDKFMQKMIDKINNDALPQLNSLYDHEPFADAMIFIRSHKRVPLADVDYDALNRRVIASIDKQRFPVVIVCIMHGIMGLWDFYV